MTIVGLNGPVTLLSAPQMPGPARPWMPVPSVNSQFAIGVQLSGCTLASIAGSTMSGTPSTPYGVSGPRFSRLSMMLLRARFAVMSA